MGTVTFEDAIRLRKIDTDVFESLQRPWSWSGSEVVPGGIIMPMAAAAAYNTVPEDFSIDSLQTHFLRSTTPTPPLQFSIQRLSDGGRFAVRLVTALQAGKTVVQVTCTFARAPALQKGKSMTHSSSRATTQSIESITLDDLSPSANDFGPWMKYQCLPLIHTESPSPETTIYTSAAQLSHTLSTNSPHLHALGIIALSDYHVLDCPPTVHGRKFGMPEIEDTTQTSTPHEFQVMTSLNHSVHFNIHAGFRADEICYIEARTPWAGDRRAEIDTRIFTGDGKLIATCRQEGYYALKKAGGEESKL